MPYLKDPTGHSIYYERYGNCGPVVILLHGLASSTRIWLRQIRILQKTCQVYALDFPGHGQSDWQEHYSLATLLDVLKLVMDECGIDRANLIAISLGCSVALAFAARYPDRVEKLILEGPIGGYHAWWNPMGWPDWLVFTLLPVVLEVSIALFGYHATAHWLNTFGVKAKRNFKLLESVQQKTDHKAIRQLLWESACAPYAGALHHVTASTLLTRGRNDPMPKRFVSYIRSHLSKVTYLEVPGTRHLVAMEKPREFNNMVIHFLVLESDKNRKNPCEHSA